MNTISAKTSWVGIRRLFLELGAAEAASRGFRWISGFNGASIKVTREDDGSWTATFRGADLSSFRNPRNRHESSYAEFFAGVVDSDTLKVGELPYKEALAEVIELACNEECAFTFDPWKAQYFLDRLRAIVPLPDLSPPTEDEWHQREWDARLFGARF